MTTQAYIDLFKRAQLEVLGKIERKSNAGSVAEYEKLLFKEIDGILRQLGVDTKSWLKSTVGIEYNKSFLETVRQLSMLPTIEPSFVGINKKAVKVITKNALGTMDDALEQVGRIIKDEVRQAGVEAAQLKLASNQTIREMQNSLKHSLAEQGYVLGVPDSRGRIMNLDSYAETYTRSITRETTNTATMNTAHELGVHLFKLTTHFPTCHICAPRQGRVYRDITFPAGDERNQFPHISQAFPGWPQYKNIHPRCRHVAVALGYSALSRETQLKYLADADKPFDKDPRTEREIKAYNLGQAEKRGTRNDRKQWERMRAYLGDEAPKTFASFRSIKYRGGKIAAFYDADADGNQILRTGKAGDSKRWLELREEYRAARDKERQERAD